MKITMVTPSYNQGRFLEVSMRSILDQEYPDLEYFVMDGGSTDGSVEIIRNYADRLAAWRSHPDGGPMRALEEGFNRSTGEIMAWINSDDQLAPWALQVVAAVFRQFPEVQWITSMFPMTMNEEGIVIGARRVEGFHAELFYRGRNAPLDSSFYSSFIQQESTFWRRGLWEKAGARMDASLRIGDFELWARFFEHAELYTLAVPLGIFRFQSESFTMNKFDASIDEFRRILAPYGRRSPSRLESEVRRFARKLPDGWRKRTGLAYPVSHIVRESGGTSFVIRRAWIV